MKKVGLVALKPHTVDGTYRYKTGDYYEVAESAAKVIVGSKLARYETEPDSKVKRGTYKRRDLTAEKK